jgi:hypothetical protein
MILSAILWGFAPVHSGAARFLEPGMPSEREKILADALYDPLDPELVAGRERTRGLGDHATPSRRRRSISAGA